jgi:hypothetical protein
MNRNQQYNPHRVVVKAVTWQRDSHGLFDYESCQITKNLLHASSSCRIVRSDKEVKLIPTNEEADLDSKILLGIEATIQGNFRVKGEEEPLWQVVRSLKNTGGCELSEGSVIKLGRVTFQVKDIGLPKTLTADYQTLSENSSTCKVCYGDTVTPENPLISPCKCSGSMQYIHLECLQRWLETRTSCRVNAGVITYTWSSLLCELCKSELPMKLPGTDVFILNINRPYILLENQGKNFKGAMHLISIEEGKNAILGRGHQSDVRIPDISVSRGHATIKYAAGRFFLQDNSSKFGTLILLTNQTMLHSFQPLTLQVGRTVLSLIVRSALDAKLDELEDINILC